MIQNPWLDTLYGSLLGLWDGAVMFLPTLIGALIVFIVGLIVAAGLERLVERIIFYMKLDTLLKNIGLDVYVQRAGMRLNSGRFLGRLVYWFVFIAFLLATTDILQLTGFSMFLRDVLGYFPQIVIAVLIMLATFVLANFLRNLVKVSVASAQLHSGKFLASLTWWVIVIFGLLAALLQLQIAVSVINTLLTGLVAMLALAGGLAFGLGGRDSAARFIERMKDDFSHR
jgi:hypothetical protein